MKMISSSASVILISLSLLSISCNKSNTSPGESSPEGTVQSNSVNAEMDDNRTSANVDTITSPGSNSYDLNTTNTGATGTTSDANMKNQNDTHGKSTQSGDNGSGQ